MKKIRITDQTLRDGQQSLWASRMTTAMMYPVAERLDHIGFEAIDMGGGGQSGVTVRFLKENPWQRMDLMCAKIRRTPWVTAMRSKGGGGFNVVPDDILLLWIERFVAHGMRQFRLFDPLIDLDNLVFQLKYAKSVGMYTIGALPYSVSPVHTDELYASKAREFIERAGVDAIMLKDAGGLLTPDRVRTLVPAIKKAIGDVTLELHTHCTTGLGPLVTLEGVKVGADQIHTSIAPLANGAAQPSMQTTVRNLRDMGYSVDVDDKLINEVSEHFYKVARQEGKPVGVPAEYDAFQFEHQVPGGMISHFKLQLAQAGLSHKLDELLHECARIRKELGWPIMITPFAQFVGTQAVLNVVNGERYKIVPDEIKQFALGYNGKLLAPIDPNVLDKILAGGSQAIPPKPSTPEPGVPLLRKKYPNISDEERLLRYACAGSQVDEMLAAGPIKTEYRYDQPLVDMLKDIAMRPKLARVYIEKPDMKIEFRRTAENAATPP